MIQKQKYSLLGFKNLLSSFSAEALLLSLLMHASVVGVLYSVSHSSAVDPNLMIQEGSNTLKSFNATLVSEADINGINSSSGNTPIQTSQPIQDNKQPYEEAEQRGEKKYSPLFTKNLSSSLPDFHHIHELFEDQDLFHEKNKFLEKAISTEPYKAKKDQSIQAINNKDSIDNKIKRASKVHVTNKSQSITSEKEATLTHNSQSINDLNTSHKTPWINNNEQKNVQTGVSDRQEVALPEYVKNSPPVYPEAARRKKQEGIVRLIVEVDEHGYVQELKLSHSSGVDALDDAAFKAVRSWRFIPAKINGQPTASKVEIPIRFNLHKNIH
jgi:TonB family protein